MRKIERIFIHHTASDLPGPQVPLVNEWHKERGFPLSELGFYVGYHYQIEADGIITPTRHDGEVGAHVKGHNEDSIGIGLSGNFSVSEPTEKQITALGDLLAELVLQHEIALDNIMPHRAVAETECYGTKLADDWWLAPFVGGLLRHIVALQKALEQQK